MTKITFINCFVTIQTIFNSIENRIPITQLDAKTVGDLYRADLVQFEIDNAIIYVLLAPLAISLFNGEINQLMS